MGVKRPIEAAVVVIGLALAAAELIFAIGSSSDEALGGFGGALLALAVIWIVGLACSYGWRWFSGR